MGGVPRDGYSDGDLPSHTSIVLAMRGNMYKTALTLFAALALALSGGAVAYAQQDQERITGPGTVACKESTDALDAALKVRADLEVAVANLAVARGKVRVLVEAYGIDFNADTANAVDVENAVAYLRSLRDALVPSIPTNPDYVRISNEMDIVKSLRDALNVHQRVSEQYQTIDFASLEKSKQDDCKVPATTTTAPPPPADEDEEVDTRDCGDFATQEAAQDAFEAGNLSLDGDLDGLACEVESGDQVEVDIDEDNYVPVTSNGIATGSL